MSTVEEITAAIAQLPSDQLARVRAWLAERTSGSGTNAPAGSIPLWIGLSWNIGPVELARFESS